MADSKLLTSLAILPLETPIDAETLKKTLSSAPFITLPGSMNLRDLGTYAPGYVKPGMIYRSGTLDFIPQPSQALLRSQLGLSHIFDFRRKEEVSRPLCDVDGVQVVSCPFKDGEVEKVPVDLPAFTTNPGEVVSRGYREMYDLILEGYTTGYRKAFEALKSADKDHAVLYHCTGGKDRTGILSALILDLMGAPVSVISEEYALTRIGTEPFKEKLLAAAVLHIAGVALADGDESARVEEALKVPGMKGLLSTNAEIMVDFMERLNTKYGSAEGYLKDRLGFGDDDVRQIRGNLKP